MQTKTLILVRHAKSSWAHFGVADFDRPLNDRGKEDAPKMAERLKRRLPQIDYFISSPARRARKTARYFSEAYGLAKEQVHLIDSLYHATPAIMLQAIAGIKQEAHILILFGHNNGITDLANMLTATRIDNMPTCGVFAVRAKADNWAGFVIADKELLFFDYPKMNDG